MSELHPIEQAIEIVGLAPLAKALGVTYQAIRKWQIRGRMPRTEWTGETHYSDQIQTMTGGKVSRVRLMGPWPKWAAANDADAGPATKAAA